MDEITKFPPGPTYKMPGKLLRQFIHDPINTLSNIARDQLKPILPLQGLYANPFLESLLALTCGPHLL